MDDNSNMAPNQFTRTQVELMNHMRLLWEQHSIWTMSTIISLVFDLPNLKYVTNRLLRNPVDFGYVFQYFYGENTADIFSDLLSEHLIIAKDIVLAAKDGNNDAVAELEQIWYENANAIADLLGKINPYWLEEQWRSLLHHHLEMVKAEAVNNLTGKYEEAINVFDEIELQSLEMADVMSEGIIKQFQIG